VNILVTGGAGFIGSHIVDACIAAGHTVTVIDDLNTGHRSNVHPNARFVEMDVRSPELEGLFKEGRFDVVSHQAARADVRGSMRDPYVYASVNVEGGINLLEAARRHGVRKIVYSSTGGCVYGDLRYWPADERHPVQPRDPYGASKAAFELYLPVYQLNYGLAYTILRYPNVYGPRQDPFGEAGVVSIFIGQMLQGRAPTINGDGDQSRDYVFVADVVQANMLVLDQGDNEIFNLGWGRGTTVNQIFHHLQPLTGYTADAVHGPAKLGEVRRNDLSADKITRSLGWTPRVSLESGLRATVEYFRPRLAGAAPTGAC
jgi:UDP-glucose 4-epimerase